MVSDATVHVSDETYPLHVTWSKDDDGRVCARLDSENFCDFWVAGTFSDDNRHFALSGGRLSEQWNKTFVTVPHRRFDVRVVGSEVEIRHGTCRICFQVPSCHPDLCGHGVRHPHA